MINNIKILFLYVSILTSFNLYSEIESNQANFYGLYELQGKRPTMEDAHSVHIENDHSFFGLFDGHGGRKVADYTAGNLYGNIIGNSNFDTNIQKTLFESYLKTNADLDNALNIKIAKKQGCTAVSALIKNKKIYLANAGDSRAVLSNNSKAIALSVDHKPDRADEKARIEQTGGFIGFWGCWRVQGDLALSRAIGDKRLSPYVIPDPEIQVREIDDLDEFLILACDGIWDVLSNQDAVNIVSASLKINDDYNLAAKALVNLAYEKGSTDNISAIIINLKKHKKSHSPHYN